MNCRRAKGLMPLFVGRDLDDGAWRAVAAHVSTCAGCRELEEGLRRGRNWLRASLPPAFGEPNYAALRRDVWRRIKSANAAGGRADFGRLILAGGAVLFLLLALFPALRTSRIDVAVPPPTVAPAKRVRAAVEDPGSVAAPRGETRAATVAPPVRRRRAPVRLPESAVPESFVRIEFQTAHPDVRIIWLVQKQEVS